MSTSSTITQTFNKRLIKSRLMCHIDIDPPRGSKWQPEIVEQMVKGLFSLKYQMNLLISMQNQKLTWSIELPQEAQEAAERVIYAFQQRAEINSTEGVLNTAGMYCFDMHGAVPFILPMAFASDFSQIDPLQHLLSAMETAIEGEEIHFRIQLRHPDPHIFKQGQNLANKPVTNWVQRAAAVSLAASNTQVIHTGPVVENQFEARLKRLIENKLNDYVRETKLSFLIKCASQTRAHQLTDMLVPALSVSERPSINLLVMPNKKSSALYLSPPEVAPLWHFPSELCQSTSIGWSNGVRAPLPQKLTEKRAGVLIGYHEYQGKKTKVILGDEDRVGHVALIGKTRMGKTTTIQNQVFQDIAQGKGIGVIDPHGELIEDILRSCIPKEREKDVILFDMQDTDYPIGLNPLVYGREIPIYQVANQVTGVIRKMFEDQWGQAQMENTIFNALSTLLAVEGSTLMDMPKLFFDHDYRAYAKSFVKDPVVLAYWRDEFEPLKMPHKAELAGPVTNRVRRFYRPENIRNVVCQTTSLDFREMMDSGKIFLASLGGLSSLATETLGAQLISAFEIAAMSRQGKGEKRPFYLYIDEVQRFIDTSLSKTLSEASKFGLHLTMANQFLNQLKGETRDAILGNVGTMIMFEPGAPDAPIFASYTKSEFQAKDFTNLGRYQTINKMLVDGESVPAFNMKTFKPVTVPDDAEERVARIRELKPQQYGRPRAEVEKELLARFQDPDSEPDDADDLGDDYLG